MDDGVGGDNWSYKTCKVPFKLSPPTNQHPVFYGLDALPFKLSPPTNQHPVFYGLDALPVCKTVVQTYNSHPKVVMCVNWSTGLCTAVGRAL